MAANNLILRIEEQDDCLSFLLLDALSSAVLASVAQPKGTCKSLVEAFAKRSRGPTWDQHSSEAYGKELTRSTVSLSITNKIEEIARKESLRLWLDVQTKHANGLAWEYLWLAGYDAPLSLHPRISLIRSAYPGLIPGFSSKEELRALLVLSNPGSPDYPDLPWASNELDQTIRALERFDAQMSIIRTATPLSLAEEIRRFKPDILHFIGHAIECVDSAALIMHGSKKRTQEPLFAEELAPEIRRAKTRLIYLSACNSAGSMGSIGNLIAKMTGAAVVGMQAPVKDGTALNFVRAFYAGLTHGEPADIAMQQARANVYGCADEWALPILIAAAYETSDDSSTTQAKHEPSATRLNYLPDVRPFFGRTSQLNELSKMLLDPSVRLVTISGMGGMGKTRLAKRLGKDVQTLFRDGVRLVECDVLENSDQLMAAIAQATDLECPSTAANLGEQLAENHLLLILDCLESLAHEQKSAMTNKVIEQILSRAPSVKVLVTTRIKLGLDPQIEHIYELEPLSEVKRKGSSTSESLELFVDAARRARYGFTVHSKNRKMLNELVKMLQGVPLALILAAGCLQHYSLEELHAKLKVRLLDLLKRRTTQKDKHASLRIVIQDSFDLLSDWEKSIAVKLSVFVGGFTLEDAKAVITDEPNIEDGINRLYDQSLLTQQERQYRALDTVREYLQEESLNANLSDIKLSHVRHYAQKIGELQDPIIGAASNAAPQLWKDIGNYRAAVRYSASFEDKSHLVAFARILLRTFLEAGFTDDFKLAVRGVTSIAEAMNDLPLQIEILGLEGTLSRREKDFAAAEERWLTRAGLCNQVGDLVNEADSYLDLADMALKNSEFEKAQQMRERFRALDQQALSGWLRASGILTEALILLAQGNQTSALELAVLAEHSIVLTEEPDQYALYVWLTLAQIYRATERYDASIDCCLRIINDSIEKNYPHNACVALLELTDIYEAQGNTIAALYSAKTAHQCFGRIPGIGRKAKAHYDNYFRSIDRSPCLAGGLADCWSDALRIWLNQTM